MNNKIEEALWADYERSSETIKELDINSKADAYKITMEDRDKIRNELIKLEQLENEKILQGNQIKTETKRERIRNILSVGTFIAQLGVSIFTIYKTFKFDETGTITSTLGKNTLNSVIPKGLKR